MWMVPGGRDSEVVIVLALVGVLLGGAAVVGGLGWLLYALVLGIGRVGGWW